MVPLPPQFRPGAVRSKDVVDGFIRQIDLEVAGVLDPLIKKSTHSIKTLPPSDAVHGNASAAEEKSPST